MGPGGWALLDFLANKWVLIGAGVLAVVALAAAILFLGGRRKGPAHR